jgi:fucose 4-O-acetylase-like acetyltransferase
MSYFTNGVEPKILGYFTDHEKKRSTMYFGQGAYETILPHVAWLMFLLTARTSLLSAAFCVGPINYSKLSPLKLKVLQLGLCLAVKKIS